MEGVIRYHNGTHTKSNAKVPMNAASNRIHQQNESFHQGNQWKKASFPEQQHNNEPEVLNKINLKSSKTRIVQITTTTSRSRTQIAENKSQTSLKNQDGGHHSLQEVYLDTMRKLEKLKTGNNAEPRKRSQRSRSSHRSTSRKQVRFGIYESSPSTDTIGESKRSNVNNVNSSQSMERRQSMFEFVQAPMEKQLSKTSQERLLEIRESRLLKFREQVLEAEKDFANCKYEHAGCKVRLINGSAELEDHQRKCHYRPIACLLNATCSEVIPFHDYILHLRVHHWLRPTYSDSIATNVIVTQEDFFEDMSWTPKWIHVYEHDFFVMLSHKLPGTWLCWVWILGTPEEASQFHCAVSLFKGTSDIEGTFPIHSIRQMPREIQMLRGGLILTDSSIRKLSQIGQNLISDICMNVFIYDFPFMQDDDY